MIQQYLDNYMNDKVLAKYLVIWMDSKKVGSVDSEKSAAIGQVYGGALRMLSNVNGYEEENIDPRDLKEFNNLFMSRLSGLELKIDNILHNKDIIEH